MYIYETKERADPQMALIDPLPLGRQSPSSPPEDAANRRVPAAGIVGCARRWATRLDLGALALSGMTLWFAFIHLRLWLVHPGVFVGLGQVLLELLQGTLLLIRRRGAAGPHTASVWTATTIGSWGFLLARPAGGAYFNAPLLFGAQPLLGWEALWMALQLAGTLAAILSLSSLGRSFGLLAANRGVQTAGPYQIVRHPAYASYLTVQFGYVLENLSLWNALLFTVVVVAQLARIRQEEATLVQDPAYRAYRRQVRYRLLPGVY
jgi:hypothetical protein